LEHVGTGHKSKEEENQPDEGSQAVGVGTSKNDAITVGTLVVKPTFQIEGKGLVTYRKVSHRDELGETRKKNPEKILLVYPSWCKKRRGQRSSYNPPRPVGGKGGCWIFYYEKTGNIGVRVAKRSVCEKKNGGTMEP